MYLTFECKKGMFVYRMYKLTLECKGHISPYLALTSCMLGCSKMRHRTDLGQADRIPG
jgi:hypothetical protein